jgi:hypothetical protein
MAVLRIHAKTDEEAVCLVRELAVYAPRRSRTSITIELPERSERMLLGALAAAETCLAAHDIRSVRIEVDGKPYLLAPQGG